MISHPVGDRGHALRVEGLVKRLPKADKEFLVERKALLKRLVADAL